MIEGIDERLDRISRELDELLTQAHESTTSLSRKKRVIMTEEEKRIWLGGEASFPKPIVKRLSDDSYHPYSSDEDLTEPKGVRFIKPPITFTRPAR